MPLTMKKVLSDDLYLRYREDIAETENLILAVQKSRERAERFSCAPSIKRYTPKKRGMLRKKKKLGSHY